LLKIGYAIYPGSPLDTVPWTQCGSPRFFGGLTVEETGEVLQVSPQTVLQDWKLARAWLAHELAES
jgi:hypothetical protein